MMKGMLSAAGDHYMCCSGLSFWAVSRGAAVGVRVKFRLGVRCEGSDHKRFNGKPRITTASFQENWMDPDECPHSTSTRQACSSRSEPACPLACMPGGSCGVLSLVSRGSSWYRSVLCRVSGTTCPWLRSALSRSAFADLNRKETGTDSQDILEDFSWKSCTPTKWGAPWGSEQRALHFRAMQASDTRQPKSRKPSKSTDPVPKGQRKPAHLAAFARNVPGWECLSSCQLSAETCTQSLQCSPAASGGVRAIHHVFLAAPERNQFWSPRRTPPLHDMQVPPSFERKVMC